MKLLSYKLELDSKKGSILGIFYEERKGLGMNRGYAKKSKFLGYLLILGGYLYITLKTSICIIKVIIKE